MGAAQGAKKILEACSNRSCSSLQSPNAALKIHCSKAQKNILQIIYFSPSLFAAVGGALLAWIVASRLSNRRDISSTVDFPDRISI